MLARIADKHGLTNKYRPIGSGKRVVRRGRPRKYLFGPPKRRKTKTCNYSSKQTNYTNTSLPTGNNLVGCLGCGTFVLIIFVIFCIIIGTSSDNSSSNSTTSSIQSIETSDNGEIDLTAFDGECGVSGRIELEKEFDSHLMETVTYVNNNSGKNISKVTLYMVHCYDGASPIDSWKYADRLNVENISVGTSKRTEWLLGTTTYGKKDFKAYIGYVLYEDGTEWGKETIDHKAVVTKNATIEVIFEEVEKFSWKE